MSELQTVVLRKLFRHRYIGGKHTDIENLTKGIPRDKAGDAKKVVEELIREKILLQKPTSYGLHVSINPEKLSEILRLLEENSKS